MPTREEWILRAARLFPASTPNFIRTTDIPLVLICLDIEDNDMSIRRALGVGRVREIPVTNLVRVLSPILPAENSASERYTMFKKFDDDGKGTVGLHDLERIGVGTGLLTNDECGRIMRTLANTSHGITFDHWCRVLKDESSQQDQQLESEKEQLAATFAHVGGYAEEFRRMETKAEAALQPKQPEIDFSHGLPSMSNASFGGTLNANTAAAAASGGVVGPEGEAGEAGPMSSEASGALEAAMAAASAASGGGEEENDGEDPQPVSNVPVPVPTSSANNNKKPVAGGNNNSKSPPRVSPQRKSAPPANPASSSSKTQPKKPASSPISAASSANTQKIKILNHEAVFDKKGLINRKEVREHLIKLGNTVDVLSDADLDNLVKENDKDGDGKLTQEEYKDVLCALGEDSLGYW